MLTDINIFVVMLMSEKCMCKTVNMEHKGILSFLEDISLIHVTACVVSFTYPPNIKMSPLLKILAPSSSLRAKGITLLIVPINTSIPILPFFPNLKV